MQTRKFFIPALIVSILSAAALACNASTVANLFATPTPTSTSTSTPTPTFTPSPTPTATATPTQTPTPLPTGVTTEEQADGSTLFIDYDNKFQLVFPTEWMVVPITKDDMSNSIDLMAEENPDLADELNTFKSLDPDVVRSVALYSNKDFIYKGYATNVVVSALSDPTLAAMPLTFISGLFEEQFKQNGIKVLTQGVNELDNPNGVEVEYIDIEQTLNILGTKQVIASRIVIFQMENGLIMVQVSTPNKFGEEILPIAEDIGASIKKLE